VELAIGRLDQLGGELVRPPLLVLDGTGRVELGTILTLVPDDEDADTSAFDSSSGDTPDTTGTTGTKVNGVSSGLREVGSLLPMNRRSEDLVT
jgi:hypothetical protein